MAGPFAIAAVTAVLRDLLNNGMADHDLSALGNVTVTNLPPDRIPVTSAEEKSQLNIFLFQVSPNPGWRNAGLPSRGAAGERLTNPPLALDLHYLVTAYGKEEFHTEALLGYAMQVLHENPVLTRAMINQTLRPALPPQVTLPPGLGMLVTSDLADQAELIKITPASMDSESMARFWSAMQAKYRPTAVYQVSVVLIEANGGRRAPLPVLRQGDQGRGPNAQANMTPPFPTIERVALPNNHIQAVLGEVVTVNGHHFAGDTGSAADVALSVRLATARRQAPLVLPVPPASRDDKQVTFTIPNTPNEIPAGVYSLSCRVVPAADPEDARSTNEVPFILAPRITGGLGGVVARTDVSIATGLGTATLNITCSPEVWPEQRVSLVLGAREVSAEPHPAQTSSLTFIAKGMAAGEHRVRLRIDGGESRLIDRTDPENPSFDETQKVELT
jgi:hypothetical protein